MKTGKSGFMQSAVAFQPKAALRRMRDQESPYPDIEGALICGGKSRRFGSDKRLYSLHGKSLFEIAFEKLSALSVATYAVFRDEVPEPFRNYPAIFDCQKYEGPIAGLIAALERLNSDYLLILPCDLPHVSIEFLRFLCSFREKGKVVVPFSDRLDPLVTIYPKEILGPIRAFADAGGSSLSQFIEQLNPDQKRILRKEEWIAAGFSKLELTNYNFSAAFPA
ncbi:MAG: molybdenum cofactor guanylyltransferase [Deltaproteobacteria bacterium]|nr:molybdenum cofactor guanylyltransferase [Deltaproteobacteria bacterium]